MWASVYVVVVALSILPATAAWAGGWNEPAGVLGLAWGASVEAARQQFPGGRLRQETASTLGYSTATQLDGIPLSASFQFVSEGGLQGVILRFPVHRLAEMVGLFERQYGLAPMRGNQQWRWEGTGVKISLGEYPSLRTGGPRGVAWLRTGALEAAIGRGGDASPSPEEPGTPDAIRTSEWKFSHVGYEDRLVRRIYRALRYPATTHGVYLVSLAFRLTPAGRPAALEVAVDPPNPDVAESVRTAVSRAQPFPLPPSGAESQRVTLALTVTIMP
jgi:hypothetical protein